MNVVDKTAAELAADRKHQQEEFGGVILIVVGLVGLVVGTSTVLKITNFSSSWTYFAILLGLAVVVTGCGLLGYGWAGGWPEQTLTVNSKYSVVFTFAATVAVSVMALWAHSANNIIWTAVSVGALGGLVHEIAQSKGTAFLPGSSSPGTSKHTSNTNIADTGKEAPDPSKGVADPAKPAPTSTATSAQSGGGSSNDQGESYLGGLLGILLGGAAGLLAISTSSTPTTITTSFIVTAFAAGIALKGISDSAASPTVGKSNSSTNTA